MLITVDRHLVLEANTGLTMALAACKSTWEPFERERHTLLASLATCAACRAVQEARVVVLDSGEG